MVDMRRIFLVQLNKTTGREVVEALFVPKVLDLSDSTNASRFK